MLAEFDPFSKIAKFDTLHAFHDATFKFAYDWQAHSDPLQQIDVPVGHAIQLAYGMIRTRPRVNREWILFPSVEEQDRNVVDGNSAIWTAFPSVPRLRYLQNVCELFAGVTEIHVVDYVREHDEQTADDIRSVALVLKTVGITVSVQDRPMQLKAREVMNIAFAISSLRPWGAIPILNKDLVAALRSALDPFFPPRVQTVARLNSELLDMSTGLEQVPSISKLLSPQQHIKFLSHVNGEKKSFFDNATSCCRFYYEAMVTVFTSKGLQLEEVRIALAAQVAISRLGAIVPSTANMDHCRNEMRVLLGSKRTSAPPAWALDVYSGFLWGWTTDSIPMDDDLINKFPRRVFLG